MIGLTQSISYEDKLINDLNWAHLNEGIKTIKLTCEL